jgi:hypothetical protein
MSKRNVTPAAFVNATPAGPFEVTFSSNTTNVQLQNTLQNSGYNGSAPVKVTIDSGVTVYSTANTAPAINAVDFGGGYTFPNGIEFVVNGQIMGCGGAGVQGGPSAGSAAMYVRGAVTITLGTNGRIFGGGGAGASCYFRDRDSGKNTSYDFLYVYGGGGAGGGRSYSVANNPSPGSYGASGTASNLSAISGSYGYTAASGGFGGGPGGSICLSGYELSSSGVYISGGGGGRLHNQFSGQVSGSYSYYPGNTNYWARGGSGFGSSIGGNGTLSVTTGTFLAGGGGGGYGARGGSAASYTSTGSSNGTTSNYTYGNPGAAITKYSGATVTFAGESVSGRVYGTY